MSAGYAVLVWAMVGVAATKVALTVKRRFWGDA